jgi:hypothetical protein
VALVDHRHIRQTGSNDASNSLCTNNSYGEVAYYNSDPSDPYPYVHHWVDQIPQDL